MSSNYIARVCQHLNVPYPHRGYWAKLQFRKAPKRPPLPEPRPGEVLEWEKGDAVPRQARTVVPAANDRVASRQKPSLEKRPARHQLISGVRESFEKCRLSEVGYLRPFKRNLVDIFVSNDTLTYPLDTATSCSCDSTSVAIVSSKPQSTSKRLISGIDQCGMLPRVEQPSDRFGWFGDSSASAWTLAFCGVLIAATLACTHRPPRLSSPLSVTPVRFVARFQTLLQPPLVTRASGGTTIDVAISPDGTRLAYVGRRGSTQQLYTRAVSDLDVIPIPGTEDAVSPFFSPDGNWVGFGADDELRKVPVAGGSPQTLCAARGLLGASWGLTNSIVFASAGDAGLRQVSADGGLPVALTMPSTGRGEIVQRTPQLLPGEKAVLFSEVGGTAVAEGQMIVQSLENGGRKVLGPGDHPRYLSSGHLIFTHGATLLAAPFDLARREMIGKPVPILDGIVRTPAAQFSVSDTGSLVYVPGGSQLSSHALVWVDRDGKEEPLPIAVHSFSKPRLSPDGRQVAVVIDNRRIWSYDLSRATLTPLTAADAQTNFPVWTPDGSRLAFSSNRDGVLNMFWMPADGSGPAERLTTSVLFQDPYSFSPDGRLLVFVELHPGNAQDIWVLPTDSGRKPRPLLTTQFVEGGPMLSPDGQWLAFVSNESGDNEVYVRPFSGSRRKTRISSDGGQELAWAPDGRELFYRSGDRMMAVDIVTRPTLRPGTPRLLFERAFAKGGPWRDYDVSLDGRRFLMLKPTMEDVPLTQLNVVLNWLEELNRLVPR